MGLLLLGERWLWGELIATCPHLGESHQDDVAVENGSTPAS